MGDTSSSASTPKGERRRNALIESAAELLEDGGFDAVRHRAVAERAGLPLASTTYYFESLDDLVTAAVEHHGRTELATCRARLAEITTGEIDDEGVVELILDSLLGFGSADGRLEPMLCRYERFVAAGRRPWLGPLMREMRVELDELLIEALALSGRRFDRERLALLIAIVDGAVVNAFIEANPSPREAARRMLLRGLQNPAD